MYEYNYYTAVLEDTKQAILDNYNIIEWIGRRDEFVEELNNDLWVDDAVTGNASGSYTFNTYQAEDYLCHNRELLEEACSCFGCHAGEMGAEEADVTIRCYLLSSAINLALEELEEDLDIDLDREDEPETEV